MAKKALVVLSDGFEEIEALTIVDLLRRAGIETIMAGLNENITITGSHDIKVIADTPLDSFFGAFDALILPGGMPGTTNLAASKKLISLVKLSHESGILCAAICAAPLVFETAGILHGRAFTCYPGTVDKIKSGTYREDAVVEDGSIITSRGVGTAIAFSLQIIRYLKDDQSAASLAEAIVYE